MVSPSVLRRPSRWHAFDGSTERTSAGLWRCRSEAVVGGGGCFEGKTPVALLSLECTASAHTLNMHAGALARIAGCGKPYRHVLPTGRPQIRERKAPERQPIRLHKTGLRRAIRDARSTPVSYTHLTLPTKRIV